MPTRDDVARRAGVSSAVVSYVVNNGPRPVASATRKRVLAAIDELDYRPNQLARSLKAQESHSVGLIAPSLGNPVYSEIALGLKDSLMSEGYSLFLYETEDDAGVAPEFAAELIARRVDGAVIIPTAEPIALIATFAARGTPLVLLEHHVPGTPSIVLDEIAGGAAAANHLLDMGHTRVGVVFGVATARDSARRIDGYRVALDALGIELNPALVTTFGASFDLAGAEAAALDLLDRSDPPTAILCQNDLIAITVLSAARKLGMGVPGDLSVVGYDDIALAAYTSPPLTTVAFPKRKLGRLAGRLLRAEMIGESDAPDVTTVVPELVVRESTAPVRGDVG